jgi:N-acetylneuraminic acid mutarotase
MPTGRTFGGSNAAVVNGILYVVGGTVAGSCTDAVEAYDPGANSWKTKAPLPTPRCGVAVAALNGLVYAAGGTDTSGSVKYNLVEVYDPGNDKWATGPSLLTCRQGAAAVSAGGKLYVIGGWAGPVGGGQCQNGTASGTQAANEVFDPGMNAWTSKKAMGTPRYGAGASLLNGRIVIAGGTNDTASALPSAESYDPMTDNWTKEPDMPSPMTGLGGGVVGNALYVVGGSNPQGATMTVESFTFGSGPPSCTGGNCG